MPAVVRWHSPHRSPPWQRRVQTGVPPLHGTLRLFSPEDGWYQLRMRLPLNVLLTLTILLAPACNTRARRAESAPSTGVPSGEPTVDAVRSSANAPGTLPPLKPVLGRPFPEGASQEVVCEAIHSKETDLWARFGHLVPLYMRGAIFVLEAGSSKEAAITQFVKKDYVHPHFPQLASCGDRTLLYISNFAENAVFGGKPFGRLHLSQELERTLGFRTLQSFEIVADHPRMAHYCRLSGDDCDALKKLNVRNEGLGMCGDLEGYCFRRLDRDPDSITQLRQACLQVPKSTLACLEYARDGEELRACKAQLEGIVCPPN